jgi:hypothetical protein
MKKGFNSNVKLLVVVFWAALLLFIPSCKESSDQESSEPTGQTQTQSAETSKDQTGEAGAADVELVPLGIKLPRPMFVGTPQNIRVPHLEKPLGRPRPPFLAPAGTKNVALGKKIASSDEEPIIGEIEMITDRGRWKLCRIRAFSAGCHHRPRSCA